MASTCTSLSLIPSPNGGRRMARRPALSSEDSSHVVIDLPPELPMFFAKEGFWVGTEDFLVRDFTSWTYSAPQENFTVLKALACSLNLARVGRNQMQGVLGYLTDSPLPCLLPHLNHGDVLGLLQQVEDSEGIIIRLRNQASVKTPQHAQIRVNVLITDIVKYEAYNLGQAKGLLKPALKRHGDLLPALGDGHATPGRAKQIRDSFQGKVRWLEMVQPFAFAVEGACSLSAGGFQVWAVHLPDDHWVTQCGSWVALAAGICIGTEFVLLLLAWWVWLPHQRTLAAGAKVSADQQLADSQKAEDEQKHQEARDLLEQTAFPPQGIATFQRLANFCHERSAELDSLLKNQKSMQGCLVIEEQAGQAYATWLAAVLLGKGALAGVLYSVAPSNTVAKYAKAICPILSGVLSFLCAVCLMRKRPRHRQNPAD